jgi:phosphoribosylpyrophosphate synthetase
MTFVTDTVPPFRLAPGMLDVRVLSAAPLFAEAIRRLNGGGGTITELLEGPA